jgi:hypothetical protein
MFHPIIAFESIFLLLPSQSLAVLDVHFTALQHETYIEPYGGMTDAWERMWKEVTVS